MTINNNTGLFESCNWNEYNLNPLTRNNWRASLVEQHLLSSQMSGHPASVDCFERSGPNALGVVGRKLESSTNCTLVNCGKLLKPTPTAVVRVT